MIDACPEYDRDYSPAFADETRCLEGTRDGAYVDRFGRRLVRILRTSFPGRARRYGRATCVDEARVS